MDLLSDLMSTPGLPVLILAAFVAGMVRGFSGFGTAMVFLPAAGQVVSPIWALTIMGIMDMIGPLPNVPRALRDGHPRDVVRLAVGLIVALPIGISLLSLMAPDVYRYAVSTISLILLVALIAGLRYRGRLSKPLIYGTGAIGGFLTGSTGLAGPPVIMLYMASTHAASVIRANLMLYLLCADALMVVLFAFWGLITLTPVLLGLLVAVPYLLANMVGAAIFNPDKEKLYRWVAYAIIATSAILGFPIWD
ncbi:sulfite exporter TauE/SafE family protein [uncultured Litoreibacter sp.]|uniref:sulfite exporter TauE/SafE family protein n=1 Tax=uncultured Litoreibacter sp. TaxID=1392394 RepID=UPI00261DCCEC|nr:sulfite exporter TauE/SafE family protein [uncultured Litoreibacter sp.]